jgi:alpha-amylase
MTQDITLAKNALAFSMLMDGIPIIYQGQEQWQEFTGTEAPYNREPMWTSSYNTTSELYGWISTLNNVRTLAISQDPTAYIAFQANPIWSDDHTVAMKKADVVTIASNVGEAGNVGAISLPASSTGYIAGQVYTDLVSCARYTAGTDGGISVTMKADPIVLYPQTRLSASNSTLCA